MSSAGQPTTRLTSERDGWEYRVTALNTEGFLGTNINFDGLQQDLDDAGSVGWELVTVVPVARGHGQTSALMSIFKRPYRQGR